MLIIDLFAVKSRIAFCFLQWFGIQCFLNRRKIILHEPLKSVGESKVAIRLHREVTAHVTVKVLAEASEDEAPAAEPEAEEAAAE